MSRKITLMGIVMSFMLLTSVSAIGNLPQRVKISRQAVKHGKITPEMLTKKQQAGKRLLAFPLGGMAKVDESEEMVVLTEDFSKFTAGSEATPDATDIADIATGNIASEYTLTPNWSGAGIFQAGGTAYIGMYTDADTEDTGFLNTPDFDLSGNGGTFTVFFRARSTSAEGDEVYVIWVNSENDYDYDGVQIPITSEWTDYSYTFSGVGLENMFIQLFPMQYTAYLDDIRITQADNGISAPKVLAPTDVTPTSFTARWEPVAKAESYLLNVYSYEEKSTGVEETTVTEGFDGLVAGGNKNKFIDEAASVFPEGWTIDVQTNGTSRHLYNTDGNYSSPSISLAFDATGDKIETPVTPAAISAISFWIKSQGADASSSITVECNNGTEWITLGSLSMNLFSTEGEKVEVSPEYIPEGTVQVRLSYTKGTGNCSIDDVSYTYGGNQRVKEYVLENRETVETSYAVSGLTAGVDYYYTVRARNARFTSVLSEEQKAVEAVELPVPVVKDATNVSDAGFTANWEAVEGAEGYLPIVLMAHKAAADEQYFLLNEDFHRVTVGTEEEPEYLGLFVSLEEYMSRGEWVGIMPVCVDGMIGLDNELGSQGLPGTLYSPAYDLSKDGGKAKLAFRAKGTDVASVVVTLYDDDEKILFTETKPLTADWSNLTFDLTGGKAESTIEIMVSDGAGILYIDDLQVSQNLKTGEVTEFFYASRQVVETYSTFETPDKGTGDSYSFMVACYVFNEEDEPVISDFSERKEVGPNTSVSSTEDSDIRVYVAGNLHVVLAAPAPVAVYTVNGICLETLNAEGGDTEIRLAGKGIYIVKAGDRVFRVVK